MGQAPPGHERIVDRGLTAHCAPISRSRRRDPPGMMPAADSIDGRCPPRAMTCESRLYTGLLAAPRTKIMGGRCRVAVNDRTEN